MEYQRYSLITRNDDDGDDDGDDDDNKKRALAKGAIIGIVVGVVAFVVFALVAAVCLCRLKLKRKKINDRDGSQDNEKSSRIENRSKDVDVSYSLGNVPVVGNNIEILRAMGLQDEIHHETPRNTYNNNNTTDAPSQIGPHNQIASAENLAANVDARSDTHVGGSQYEMNTARTVISENQGLNNFRNTIISVSSIDDDDYNRYDHAPEKYGSRGSPSNPQNAI
ncbi:unnamed protein product [Clonostachys rosea f. rosea IK726]|uniref:Uncharacterized protein n=1 Tax=Clonostachys rosea f. rosea IK726 TaxID=1349383 RepID=A0ACA9UL69_BIOOC|nr:unnamed protein product [Clonostachys rosea f. rosea IK726]